MLHRGWNRKWWGEGGEGEGSELIMGVIHWTKISGNFSPRLNGSVQSNRKSFENTGPLFEVDHFSWWDWSEFWLSGSHLIFSLLSLLAFIPHPLDPCLFHPRFSFPAVVSLTTKDKTHQKKKCELSRLCPNFASDPKVCRLTLLALIRVCFLLSYVLWQGQG